MIKETDTERISRLETYIQLLEDKLIEAEHRITVNDEVVWEMISNIISVMKANNMVVKRATKARFDPNQQKLENGNV